MPGAVTVGPEPVVARRTGPAGEPSFTTQVRLRTGDRRAAATMHRVAAWAEAGRIAAAGRNTEFFQSRESRSVVEWASGPSSLPQPARAAVQRVESSSTSGRPPDWSALERDLTELLRLLGS